MARRWKYFKVKRPNNAIFDTMPIIKFGKSQLFNDEFQHQGFMNKRGHSQIKVALTLHKQRPFVSSGTGAKLPSG